MTTSSIASQEKDMQTFVNLTGVIMNQNICIDFNDKTFSTEEHVDFKVEDFHALEKICNENEFYEDSPHLIKQALDKFFNFILVDRSIDDLINRYLVDIINRGIYKTCASNVAGYLKRIYNMTMANDIKLHLNFIEPSTIT